jgi:hypothetical protein
MQEEEVEEQGEPVVSNTFVMAAELVAAMAAVVNAASQTIK